jgi:hypothetical protein
MIYPIELDSISSQKFDQNIKLPRKCIQKKYQHIKNEKHEKK